MWNVNDAAINALRTLFLKHASEVIQTNSVCLLFFGFIDFLFSFFLFSSSSLEQLTTRRTMMESNDYLKRWRAYYITAGRRTAKGRNGRISGSQCLTNSNPQAIKFSRSVTLSSLSSEIRGILEFIEPIPDTKKIKQIDAGKSRFISRVRNYLIIEMPARVQIRFRVAFECGTKETNNS